MSIDHPLRPFHRLLGDWSTEGVLLDSCGREEERYRAADLYELLPGGHFLLHRWDAWMPGGRSEGVEVIGRAPDGKDFVLISCDGDGVSTTMRARIDGNAWRIQGDRIRFQGGFETDDVFAGVWERRGEEQADWLSWLTVRLTRAAAGRHRRRGGTTARPLVAAAARRS